MFKNFFKKIKTFEDFLNFLKLFKTIFFKNARCDASSSLLGRGPSPSFMIGSNGSLLGRGPSPGFGARVDEVGASKNFHFTLFENFLKTFETSLKFF